MIVILAEKPSAAQNFAQALGGRKGTFNGEEYTIVNSYGHLYGFPKDLSSLVPKDKKDFYTNWEEENLPWDPNDFKWIIKPLPKTEEAIKRIAAALNTADEVCIATDNDSSGEGDLLAQEILLALKWQGPVTRMHFDDESPKCVQNAFINRFSIPKAVEYGPFVKARARSKFDYLSMQFTRYASIMAKNRGHRMLLRQGRLKSVMVYMVGHQLNLIKNYKKVPYYEVRYKDENDIVYKREDSEDIRFRSPSEIDINSFKDSEVVEDGVVRKGRKPGKLLDLAGLASLLAAKGADPNEVLATYQKLYEQHIVSYPRTDDKKITPAQYEELKNLRFDIAKVVGIDASLLTHDEPWGDKHVTEKATHGANRPGKRVPKSLEELSSFGPSGPAIYEILSKNALSIFGELYTYDYYTGHIKDYPEFIGHASIPIDLGFKAIFDVKDEKDESDPEEEDSTSPLGKNGTPFIYEGSNPKPKNPTMKWLVGPGGMLEKYNVGTGATRTSTFSDISNEESKSQLIKMSKKGALSMTEIGETSYILIRGCQIADPTVTEKLLQSMDLVGAFKMSEADIMHSITPIMLHDMEVMKRNSLQIPLGNDSVGPPKEKFSGVYIPTGEEISFNREWGGYKFTDEELKLLLNGETIEISPMSSRTGQPYTVKGNLAEQKYRGKRFWGFQKIDEFPEEYAKHRFTEVEKKLLLSGEEVFIEKLWSMNKGFWYAGKIVYKDGRIKPVKEKRRKG